MQATEGLNRQGGRFRRSAALLCRHWRTSFCRDSEDLSIFWSLSIICASPRQRGEAGASKDRNQAGGQATCSARAGGAGQAITPRASTPAAVVPLRQRPHSIGQRSGRGARATNAADAAPSRGALVPTRDPWIECRARLIARPLAQRRARWLRFDVWSAKTEASQPPWRHRVIPRHRRPSSGGSLDAPRRRRS